MILPYDGQHFKDANRFGLALDYDFIHVSDSIGPFELPIRGFAQQDLRGILLADAFQACGEIDAIHIERDSVMFVLEWL